MAPVMAVRPRYLHSAAMVLLAASLHACSDSTGPGDEPPASLSEVLLEASDPMLTELASRGGVGPVSMTTDTRFTPGGCTYDAGTQRFVCATNASSGLTFERSFVLFDAAGSRQSRFDPASTASVQTKTHVFGTMTSSNSRMTVDDTDERTVSGLLSDRHVLNGASMLSMTGTLAAPGAPAGVLSLRTSTKTENLMLPSRTSRWPGPGTMTTESTSSFSDLLGPPVMSRMKMTFTGTKCATIEMRFGDDVQTSTIDLSNPNAMTCTP
jgi:hypothetical protein